MCLKLRNEGLLRTQDPGLPAGSEDGDGKAAVSIWGHFLPLSQHKYNHGWCP